MGRTQKNTHNNIKHVEHQDATDIQKNAFLCVLIVPCKKDIYEKGMFRNV